MEKTSPIWRFGPHKHKGSFGRSRAVAADQTPVLPQKLEIKAANAALQQRGVEDTMIF